MNYFPEEVTIGFQEIPDEISLIIPLAGCGHKCPNCHSPHYQDKNNGVNLSSELLFLLLDKYKNKVSCVCFFNGEDSDDLASYLRDIKRLYNYKIALYSGFYFLELIDEAIVQSLDYIKLGGYEESLGGLNSRDTNQKLYKLENSQIINITHKFWSNND
jgi:anaerobic ribonucleoside-triphosphate reductase activating protein